MGKEQLRRRGTENTLEELAQGYSRQAADVLSGKDSVVARDEISRFAKKISSEQGPDQYEYLQNLVSALVSRRSSFFGEIPDDEHERAAFALELVRQYEKTLQ
jgi:hypothetical protein